MATAVPSSPAGASSAGRRVLLWSDRLVGPVLGGVGCLVLALIVGLVYFVFDQAWPSFSANGLAWFGPGGDANQQLDDIFGSPPPLVDTPRACAPPWGAAP